MPLFLIVVTTLLMLQLRSFSRTLLVLVTAPLGLIGACWFLLLSRVVVSTWLLRCLRCFSRTLLVLVTWSLGLVGAWWFLLLFRMPSGSVALLGTIALAGMVMRNSVILVDHIEQDIGAGHDR